MVPKNTHSFKKRNAAPSWPLEIIYLCKCRPKRAWNYAYLARKIQIFLGKGARLPSNPRQGAGPLYPRERLTPALVCLFRSQLFEPPPPMLKIFLNLCRHWVRPIIWNYIVSVIVKANCWKSSLWRSWAWKTHIINCSLKLWERKKSWSSFPLFYCHRLIKWSLIF